MFITGGEELTLTRQTFNLLPGLNILKIDNTKFVSIKEQAFNDLKVQSAFRLEIENSEQIIFESHAFKNTNVSILVNR